MVDSEYSMDIYKSTKINIGTVMRNVEMWKFVPYHLGIEKVCKHAVKKLPYLHMCDKAILENVATSLLWKVCSWLLQKSRNVQESSW